jgi:hypothetical protein
MGGGIFFRARHCVDGGSGSGSREPRSIRIGTRVDRAASQEQCPSARSAVRFAPSISSMSSVRAAATVSTVAAVTVVTADSAVTAATVLPGKERWVRAGQLIGRYHGSAGRLWRLREGCPFRRSDRNRAADCPPVEFLGAESRRPIPARFDPVPWACWRSVGARRHCRGPCQRLYISVFASGHSVAIVIFCAPNAIGWIAVAAHVLEQGAILLDCEYTADHPSISSRPLILPLD